MAHHKTAAVNFSKPVYRHTETALQSLLFFGARTVPTLAEASSHRKCYRRKHFQVYFGIIRNKDFLFLFI